MPADSPAPTRVVYTGTRLPQPIPITLDVRHLPMLTATALDVDPAAIADALKASHEVAFFSPRAVQALALQDLKHHFNNTRLRLWAVGAKTSEAIRAAFDREAVLPTQHNFERMAAEMAVLARGRITAFTLEDGPRDLSQRLPHCDVHQFEVYRTYPITYPDLGSTLRRFRPHWLAFTSPRGVDALADQLDPTAASFDWKACRSAAIGPTTAAALHEHDVAPDIELQTPGSRRLLRAIDARSRGIHRPS